MSSRFARHTPIAIETAREWSVETLVEPSPFYGANGIRVAADGRCWVAQFRGGCISAWDPETGAIVDVVPPGASLDGPDDLAFAADGTAYVTEYRRGRVVRLAGDGTAHVALDDSPNANGITVDGSGRLFVDEFRAGGRLIEVDLARPGEGRVIADLDFPNAFARGPDGRLYVQNVIEGTVSSIDPDGDGSLRAELDGFAMPSALKFDPRGRVVVVEFTTGRVVAVDLETRERELLVELEPGLDNLDFDPAGRLYVSSGTESYVVRVVDGRIDARTPSGLSGPYGVTVAPDGAVVAGDVLRVVRLAPGAGALETIWQLDPPARAFQVLSVAAGGDALYAVTGTGELRRLDPAAGTHELLLAAEPGNEVVAVAASPAGGVAARRDGRLVELGRDGSPVRERPSGLTAVTAVAATGEAVAACDVDAGTAVVLAPGADARTIDGLAGPEGIALAADGTVFVAEADGRRISMHAPDGARTDLATGLPLGFPFPRARDGRRAALALAPDGSLVVGCDGDGGIRRLTRASV